MKELLLGWPLSIQPAGVLVPFHRDSLPSISSSYALYLLLILGFNYTVKVFEILASLSELVPRGDDRATFSSVGHVVDAEWRESCL